jgi:dihydroorotate dehydrogenase
VPDWFYRTVSRPLLFRLPAEQARRLACGFMGKIGDLPSGLGGAFIDFLGHMRPDARLEQTAFGRKFIGPVGLGTRLDGTGAATNAWTRFGFSFLELGPVTETTQPANNLRREEAKEALLFEAPSTIDAKSLAQRLAQQQASPVHLIIRLRLVDAPTPQAAAEVLLKLAQPLLAHTPLFSLDISRAGQLPPWSPDEWQVFWRSLQVREAKVSWLLVLPVSGAVTLRTGISDGCAGIIMDAHQLAGSREVYGPVSKPLLLEALKQVRAQYGSALPIIAAGGTHQPADAVEVLQAGATFVQIDTGLIYSGPGLPKRINEAVLSTLPPAEAAATIRLAKLSWFWTALMGVGMLVGSILALWIALTRVVMPYDEAFCGISRAQLEQINERLIPFMSHDRVSLAGTMIAIGLLYISFSWFGSRRGEHWAK